MNTARKGTTAEAAVLRAFVDRGLPVLVPFGGGEPYDLVVHLSGRSFLRVQCKAARLYQGCILFNSRTTDHGRGRLRYLGLADVFGVYFDPAATVYLVPVAEVDVFAVRLRIDPARNNQRRRVRRAADYEIDRWSHTELCELAEGGTRSNRRLAGVA